MSFTPIPEGSLDWDVLLNAALVALDARVTALEAAPPSGITSVNGQTGPTVSLSASDVGAASSSHTHTTSQVTGLDAIIAAKADDSQVVKISGNQTIAGTKTFSSAPSVPDGSFTVAKTSTLQALLDARKDRIIRQNADGSWPSRLTGPNGADRTVTQEWEGTLPGPVIGSTADTAVAGLDVLIVTDEIPT